MSSEPINNENDETKSKPFSGELEVEDLEFLSQQQAEPIKGGLGFISTNISVGNGSKPKTSFSTDVSP